MLHETEHTRITRLVFAEGAIVRKEPLGPDAERRLRHEVAVLERLRGVDGVAQLVDAPRYPGSIVMADAGDANLAGLAKPLTVDGLIGLAVELAHVVAGMHRRGVMHRDISPANIVISGSGAPCLVDFALATSFAEIRPAFTHHNRITGTLAYLAPEQTGRTGRSMDHRADLYALGATLYELATGEPPYGSDGPLRLTRDRSAHMPVPPAVVNRAVPGALSEIIVRLLETEPDNRYQSAEGVIYDLERLGDVNTRSTAAPQVGEHDSPLRLLPPSRLVGRNGEMAALEAAFEDALASRCRGVLVGGAPGVGKTVLVDELRPVVAGGGGWFVAGKFDQYRRDLEFDALCQALRALGRLLLAEPEEELVKVRQRILEAVGPNAGLLTAALPELSALLAVPPDPGDPLTARVRAQRASFAVLRAVASRTRPVVLFLDDLQWAGHTPLGFIDLVLNEKQIEGLLVVGAYREDEVDALAALMSRWREQAGVRHLRLANLPVPSLVTMVAEMLHVERATAAGLVEVIEPRTSGNPYETVELLSTLRSDGVLTATAAGWRWDRAVVRAHLGQADAAGSPAARVESMPARSRRLVEAMACLGGRAEASVLQAATGEPAPVVERRLEPALNEGLLALEPGVDEVVWFCHDRIREVILGGLDPPRRRELQLAMARRLATVPELFAASAEQYLPVVDAVDDPAEVSQLVRLLRRAADQATLIGNYALVNAQLAAALQLIDLGETDTLAEVHTGRHAALYSMGRLEEADDEYCKIEKLSPTVLERADATVVQVRSLIRRKRFAEAVGLGLESLRELGMTVPPADRLPAELDHQFDYLYQWLDRTEAADDLARPEITDPTLLVASCLLNAILPATVLAPDPSRCAWLSLQAMRIWLEHGPGRNLCGPASIAAFAAVTLRGDYAGGYRAARRIVALGESRGYEPDTSHARLLFAVMACWFEPIESGLHAAELARDGLILEADPAYVGFAYRATVYYSLDCASLDTCVTEIETALAFVRRAGNEQMSEWLDSYGWLTGVLRGEIAAEAEVVPVSGCADNPQPLFHARLNRAIAAAIFGDLDRLMEHTSAAMPLLPAFVGRYPAAMAHVLRGLALAAQAHASPDDDHGALLSELDEVTRWLADRAADAPDNFLHLLRLLEAERAWAVDDFRAAVLGYDAARREAAQRQRPWHRALIAERAARFYLAHGIEHAGYDLLAQARREYLAWGATAKGDQLDWARTLRPRPDAIAAPGGRPADLRHHHSTVMPGTIDLFAILSASQALSSQTSVEGLRSRLVQMLGTMTGATGVYLPLWSDDRQDWLLPTSGDGIVPVSGTGHKHMLPTSVLRYAQRLREPLVVGDATRDDRFNRDPYFTDISCCSLLAVPILSRGTLRAVLLLENRRIRGAFTVEQLDGVKLIADQLAVSLDNVRLYSELTASRARIVTAADQARWRIERDLHDGAQQRLVSLALQLRAVQAAVPRELRELASELGVLAAEATGALEELPEIVRGVQPTMLAKGGLRAALQALARRSPVLINLSLRLEGRRPEHIDASVYYIVAESLANAAKHAHSSAITVTVEADPANAVLRVAVRDDGVGGADFARGTGLFGLKDRVETLGGRIFLYSPHGAGTTLRVELPITDVASG